MLKKLGNLFYGSEMNITILFSKKNRIFLNLKRPLNALRSDSSKADQIPWKNIRPHNNR